MPEPAVIFEREMLFHLAFLFEFSAANELIEVAWIGERDGRKEIGAYLQRFGEIDALIKTATDKNAAGFNVYVGAAARHPHTPPFGRAKDCDFSAAYALWCDLDSRGGCARGGGEVEALPAFDGRAHRNRAALASAVLVAPGQAAPRSVASEKGARRHRAPSRW